MVRRVGASPHVRGGCPHQIEGLGRAPAIILAILLLSVSSGSALGETPAEDPGSHVTPVSTDEARAIDIAGYSEAVGVSGAEAARRVDLIPSLAERLEGLDAAAPSQFAGGWLEHQPEFQLVARYVGHPDDDIVRTLATLAEGMPVKIVMGASYSLSELQAGRDRATDLIHELLPDAGFGIDPKSNSIELRAPAEVSADVIAEIIKASGVAVTQMVFPTAATTGHSYGGRLFNGNYYCTTGFSSVDAVSGLKGVLTAGHCVGSSSGATYYDTSSNTYAVTLGGTRWDANQDFAWYRSTVHSAYPLFYDGSVYRNVTSTQTKNHMLGQPVCHYGRTTGFSCGFVDNINYNPGGTYCNGGPCASVWLAVSGPNYLKCWHGDSGGPWFWVNAAWGLYSGQAATGPAASQCYFAIGMPIEALTYDGVNTRVLLDTIWV